MCKKCNEPIKTMAVVPENFDAIIEKTQYNLADLKGIYAQARSNESTVVVLMDDLSKFKCDDE